MHFDPSSGQLEQAIKQEEEEQNPDVAQSGTGELSGGGITIKNSKKRIGRGMNGRIDCDALPPESLSGSNTAFSTAGIGNIREFWVRIILQDLV